MTDGRFRTDCWYAKTCTKPTCHGCVRYEEMKALIDSSGIPKRYAKPTHLSVPANDVDFESYRKLGAIKSNVTKMVESGKNLLISSSGTGNGKTSWAIAIMLKYFDSIWLGNGLETRGLFISATTLLQALKDFDNPLSHEYIDSIKNADLVVWDDIAVKKLTEYEHTNLLMLLDYRISNEKSNIYTTNIDSDEDLAEKLGTRLASRVMRTAMRVRLQGKDRRGVELTE